MTYYSKVKCNDCGVISNMRIAWVTLCICKKGVRVENEINNIIIRTLRLQFKKIRPMWLKGIRGNLEIDMWNDRYKLGFEYQGEGHYLKYKSNWGFLTEKCIQQVKHNDVKKRKIFRKLGYILIQIPCFNWKKLQTNKDKKSYILGLIRKEVDYLKSHNIVINSNIECKL